MPNLIGTTVDYAASRLKDLGLQIEIEGSGSVVSQTPAAGKQAEKYSIVKVKGNTEEDTTTYYGIE